MSRVVLKNVSKSFGEVQAVDSVNLEIGQGEFVSLLGPSGCGKTTTLRMIAGFEFPDSGEIYFDKRNVTFLKPNSRNTGMVFQNFALFPHMTVFENVAFGLQARKTDKKTIRVRVGKALDLVRLTDLGTRKVSELSGGQQQRVALARAVVIEPEILLLDEPLSNLDARLRYDTREEIKMLQRRLGITTIYVTHDQDEALTLSDRIAVLDHGVCQQIGTPEEIYSRPANRFVAEFVGKANILNGKLLLGDRAAGIEITSRFHLSLAGGFPDGMRHGDDVQVAIRSENIHFADSALVENRLQGILRNISFSGAIVDYDIDIDGFTVRAKQIVQPQEFTRKIGDEVEVHIDASQIYLFKQRA